uniref:Uncharacterized protein n=1 Tax=Rhizophora mucronata TaxID=61149 RepID=A0A2P2NEV3_RHIMU
MFIMEKATLPRFIFKSLLNVCLQLDAMQPTIPKVILTNLATLFTCSIML